MEHSQQSAYTDPMQQQYHQNYPQQQSEPEQAYVPSQAQAYEAYYAQQHYDPSTYHHFQQYDYYSAASVASAVPASYHQATEVAAVPNISRVTSQAPVQTASSDPSSSAQILQQNHPEVTATGSDPAQVQQPGLNPAAAAAVASLSQLSEFAGSMKLAQWASANQYQSTMVQPHHDHQLVDPYAYRHQHPYQTAQYGFNPALVVVYSFGYLRRL